jgi:hypothetical protein
MISVVRFAAFVPLVAGLIGLPGSATSQPQVLLVPNVVTLGKASSVAVSGIDASTLQVRLAGASARGGRALPWTELRRSRGAWRGTLPAPELRGVYPVELRVRPGAPVVRVTGSFLRVFATGTLARPAFRTPEQVARWWVHTRPGGATLVAMRRWPRPAFDRRDRRLHQLLVLAYSRVGLPSVRDRLGIFITAVRDGYGGGWRLLEATATP